jgi:hypothetical protein
MMKSISIYMRGFTSPRVRGEVDAKRRVRGAFRDSECAETPPHPDLLPARGEKGSRVAARFCGWE